jgi:hypothetical protein
MTREKESIKEELLTLVDEIGETVLCSESEKDRIRALCDELLPHTAEPRPIENQQAAEGVWRTRFASFGAKHSDNQPMQHMSSLMLQSFGNLPKVPSQVRRLNQEIEQTSRAYNNVVYVSNEQGTANGIIVMAGQYSADEENPQRYSVAFQSVSFKPGDGQSEQQLREDFGMDADVPLAKEFRPPKLHSDIVFVDDDLRINYGSLGGFYVLERLSEPGYSVQLN